MLPATVPVPWADCSQFNAGWLPSRSGKRNGDSLDNENLSGTCLDAIWLGALFRHVCRSAHWTKAPDSGNLCCWLWCHLPPDGGKQSGVKGCGYYQPHSITGISTDMAGGRIRHGVAMVGDRRDRLAAVLAAHDHPRQAAASWLGEGSRDSSPGVRHHRSTPRKDQRVPRSAKIAVAFTGLWVLSPIDLIPEFLPVIGPLDDVVVVALALRFAARRVPHEAIYEAWPADPVLLSRLLGHRDGLSKADPDSGQ